MKLKVIHGNEIYDDNNTGVITDLYPLSKIYDLDCKVYSKEHAGIFKNMQIRFNKNKDTFTCMINEDTNDVIGYINYFPCTDELFNDIMYNSEYIRDDDILDHDIECYNNINNNLYIISIVIDDQYQDNKENIITLTNAWIDHLNELNKDYPLSSISATTISEHGRKFCNRLFFDNMRELKTEDKNEQHIVCICKDDNLNRLLNKQIRR